MPKVLLTDEQKMLDAEYGQNETLSAAVRDLAWRAGLKEKDLCSELEITPPTVRRMKDPANIGSVKFETVRRVAHVAKLSKSEWLKLGGYEK